MFVRMLIAIATMLALRYAVSAHAASIAPAAPSPSPTAGGSGYTLVDLGEIRVGGFEAQPIRFNDLDDVVGTSTRACVEYTGGHVLIISRAVDPSCYPSDINARGTIIGEVYDGNTSYAFEKFASESRLHIVAPGRSRFSGLYSINDDDVAVGYYQAQGMRFGVRLAFFANGAFVPLGQHSGRKLSLEAMRNGLNRSGTLAVDQQCGDPLRSSSSRPATIGFGTPDNFSTYLKCGHKLALALNDNGQMLLVEFVQGSSFTKSLIFQTSTPTAPPVEVPILGGCTTPTNYGPITQNDAGQILGYNFCHPTAVSNGNWLYVPGQGVIDVGTLLPSNWSSSFSQVQALDLNNNGDILMSGQLSESNSAAHWLILKPPAALRAIFRART